MSGVPRGFDYAVLGDRVVITHRGRPAATLRHADAEKFLAEVAASDPQQLMARLTGNYKRGNERAARQHARNRDGR